MTPQNNLYYIYNIEYVVGHHKIYTDDHLHACALYYTELNILGAAYGKADVTDIVKSKVSSSQSLNVAATNGNFGGNWPVPKTLVVVYQHEGYDPKIRIARERHTMNIDSRTRGNNLPFNNPDNNLRIVGAVYALQDVTHILQSEVDNNRLEISVPDHALLGDPNCGAEGSMVVVYQVGNGPYKTEIFVDETTVSIP